MLDLIVRGGLVIDGSGRSAYQADVGIDGDRIAVVGDLSNVEANAELDASGCIVAPGFIDIHSHSDFTVLVDPRAQSSIVQGVTTEIVGNCGHGCAPIAHPEIVTGNIYGYTSDVPLDWRSVGEYLERVDTAHTAINIATLIPNGNLRLAVMGAEDRASTRSERNAMMHLLKEGMAEGAFGFSTGLEYPTERASIEEELIPLCRIAAQHGGIYATHTRNRDTDPLPAIEEALRTARTAGSPVQISHIIPRKCGLHTPWMEALEMVDAARTQGIDAAFDAHTRLYGTTNLSTVLPPDMLQPSTGVGAVFISPSPLTERTASIHDHPRADEYRPYESRPYESCPYPPGSQVSSPSTASLATLLRDPSTRNRIKDHPSLIASWGSLGWEHVYLFSSKGHPDWIGHSFAELSSDGNGLDAVLEVLIADADDPHYPMGYCLNYEEEWLRGTMRHPLCSVGSDATALCPDGPLAGSSFLGAYTWVGWFLRALVREHRDLTWEEGIRKLTAMPAERIGLRDRGKLELGYHADVIAFDASRFRERGTLEKPNVLAEGMEHVVVNGVVTMARGEFTGDRGGRALRRT